jgi:hypothetical protein
MANKNEKNAAAVALGRLGGLKGGKARAQALTAAARKRIAQRAAAARWKDRRQKSENRGQRTENGKEAAER